MNNINKFDSYRKVLTWFAALTLSALAAGCGGGRQDPILGAGDGAVITGTAPTVTSATPLPNATAVATNTRIITATFTKAMDPATLTAATFTLACPAGTAQTGTVAYVTTASVATLTLAANLPANTTCTATITTGAKDTTGIPLAANFTWTFTTGTAPDTTAPTVTGTINANGATNVAINTKVGATFSEVMDPATINATTFTVMQGATAVAGTVTYAGINAVFTPASNLAPNTTYTVTVTTGAKDVRGNALANNFVISWTTGAAPDTTAPTVTGTINANGATNVAINTNVGATFSEGMDPLTITNVNLTLKETVSGTAVTGVTSYSGVSAVFNPVNNLAANTGYTVTVKGGASGVKDLAGNPMASDFIISWTTGATPDTTAPTVTGTIHTNGQTNVAVNTAVGATFSEAMNPLTITNVNFTLTTDAGAVVPGLVSYSGVSALLRPLSNLAPSTHYNVTVKGGASGVKDLAGNPMAADFKIGWTTAAVADTTAPTVTLVDPVNLETGVSTNSGTTAVFSEWLDPLTITTATFTVQGPGGTPVPGTVLLGTSFSNALFSPLSSLAAGTTYTSTIKGGALGIKDLAGNAMAIDYVWSWTTAGVVVPPPIVFGPGPAGLGPDLGAAAPFGFFSSAALTNSGISQITGDAATTSVVSSVVGFHDSTGFSIAESSVGCTAVAPCGTVTGTIYANNKPLLTGLTTVTAIRAAALNAFSGVGGISPAARPGGLNVVTNTQAVTGSPSADNLGGRTLAPGIYYAVAGGGATYQISGNDLTLDAGGNPNAVWVFQVADGVGTLTVNGRAVVLANGAQAKNVYWYVPGGATINTGSAMVGTMIADASITFGTAGVTTPTTLAGRALVLTAGATMVSTTVNVPPFP